MVFKTLGTIPRQCRRLIVSVWSVGLKIGNGTLLSVTIAVGVLMNKDVKRDLLQGLADTGRALALLRRHSAEFGSHPVELARPGSGDIAAMLDIHSGIDAYQLCPTGVRGIACRAQRGTVWRTFSIRVDRLSGTKTEYSKRLLAIKHKMLYPHWHMHSYHSDSGDVRAIGLALTSELFTWVYQREKAGYKFDREQAGNAFFIAPSWDDYARSGHFFFEYAPALVKEQTA